MKINRLKTFIILSTFCLFGTQALAYIPPYWMIMSRMAENHGKGHYKIEQKVAFEHLGETVYVQERWYIEDEDNFRLEATGLGPLRDKIKLTYVYTGGRRYYVDQNGIRKFVKTPDELFEPYFHFRRSKAIKPKLVALKIAPPASLKSESHRYSERNPLPHEENYVRLGRSGGVVTYTLGEASPIDASTGKPGIWIEQDQFNLRKIRFATGTEIRANNYQKRSRDAWLPNDLVISWSGQTIKATVDKVEALAASKTVKDLFDAGGLNFGKDPKVATSLSDDAIISKFYQTLR